MLESLAVIVAVVRDQERALEFYTKSLGLEKKTDFTPAGGQRWVTVGIKDQNLEISLVPAGSSPNPNLPQSKWEPGKNPAWTFRSSDIRKDFEELKARDVKFIEREPTAYPWGLVATFTDPDGNVFTLLQQGAK